MNVKHVILSIFVASLFMSTKATKLYVDNQYGVEIICEIMNSEQEKIESAKAWFHHNFPHAQYPRQGPHITSTISVPAGETKCLGNLDDIYRLFLKTSSYFSRSTYINEVYTDIKKALESYRFREQIGNKDAVLVVKPSGIMSGWNITVKWGLE